MPSPPPREQQHARTEPSTPLRTRPPTNTSLSVPSSSRSRLSFVALPPDDLTSVLGRPPTYFQKSAKSTKPSSLQSSRRSSGLQSRHESVLSTPQPRRLSDHLTVRRRRRSSTGATYVSGYHGPITKDFLRTFSRALIHDQQNPSPEYESEKVFQALDYEHRLHSLSPQDRAHYSEFDYSLPLPSDDAMKSPPLTVAQSASPVATPKDTSKENKPAFKSYLERILESRKRSSMFEHETPSEVEDIRGVNDIISTSKFVIENTIQGLPEFTDNQQSPNELNIRLAEPLAVNDNAIHTDSEESSEGDYRAPELTMPRRTHRPSLDLQKTPEYESYEYDDANRFDASQLDSMSAIPEKIDSPQDMNFQDDLDDIPQHPSSDQGLISGHFTIDNDDIDTNPALQLQPGLSLTDDELNSENIPPQPSTTRRITVGSGKKRVRSSNNLPISKYLLKGMVSTVSHLPGASGPAKKKSKLNRISPALLQVVLRSSNDFLQQTMSTLKAYAEHRGSDKISIQDAVLYLNRVKIPTSSTSEMNRVAKLAHDLFPLETLVSLDNSLQQSTIKKLKRTNIREVGADNDEDFTRESVSFGGAQKSESHSETEVSLDDNDDDY
ncbi:uncharacterized protein CXQ87_000062 [Candidozyma duobushaemuli]|uniref:CENP-T/Histone H4 histone fold domain-containing protein n=2 Tax=Candidozyma TaxID=3303203 RepID=A0ABX8I3X3_9ASCO|nr:uncharacterized protein CXQ87_000062 [[Candida] duobushaemulonis]PVH17181.1 hypothetical protein CXQ87_000062 [[Candida] duobushaemulonis]QWU85843.1 hypothetical protein CA3LBN_000061 [[Candida] haemuloni]